MQRTGGAPERTGGALDRTGVALQRNGVASDMPKRCTIISVVDGHRHNHDNYHHSTDTERAHDWV